MPRGDADERRVPGAQLQMRIAIVNSVFPGAARTPEETLDRLATLTGWAEAVRGAGASSVDVHQRFRRAATIDRAGIVYWFHADGAGPRPSPWFSGARDWHRAIAERRPDLVHVNGLDHPRLVRRLRRHLPPSCAIVVQDHGGFDPRQLRRPRAWWMRRGLQAADALLVAAARQRAGFEARRLVPPSGRIRDVMEASTTLRPAPRPPRGRSLALLWVGRLNANKDPLTVLKGFAAFVRRRPDVTLTFVYDDAGLEPALRETIAADAALGDRVRLAGAVPHEQLAAFYADADVLVVGSHREGSGYAVIEALACGVIPVVTDIPSFRALTDEARVGALWPPGDAASLADALERVASAPMGPQSEACRSLFVERFSWEAIGARALAIYREILRG
jgi:glycosyltransferase involved in cell wall biosynthesis